MLPADVSVEVSPELLADLTFGEHETGYEVAGADWEALLRGDIRPRGLMALVYVVLRRDHPDVTLDDVRALKMSVIRPVSTPPNPTGAGS